MNATNALDEILNAACNEENTIADVTAIMYGRCIVTLDDGTRVQLTAEIID